MSVYSNELIDDLANSEDLGAGNFLQKLLTMSTNLDAEIIFLDKSIILPCGKSVDSLSLMQLSNYCGSWSAWYEKQGVLPKTPIGLYLEDDIHYLVHYIALTTIGAIPVSINSGLKPDIVNLFLQRMRATMLICSCLKHDSLRSILDFKDQSSVDTDLSSLVVMEDIVLTDGAKPRYVHRHQPNDPVLLGHTSGTTGIPKGVQFNHRGFLYGVKKQLNKQVGDRIMSALPHSHASAISIMMSSLLRGSTVKIQTRKDPDALLEDIASYRPDLFASFPKIYVDLCRRNLAEYDLSSISYWLSTGDSNHEPHIKNLIQYGSHIHKGEKREGSLFIDNLGSSEFGFAAFRNLHKLGSDQYNRRIGEPFDWVSAAILNDYGEEMPVGEIGLLGVQSESVTAGYWNNTLLSEKNRLGGYWLTGDLAYKDEQGAYYHVDRTTDSIRSSTGTLYSCQTEEQLLSHFPEIFDCSIVGVKAEDGFSLPVIEVELRKEVDTLELLTRINTYLSDNHMPNIARLSIASAEENTGVTGKKLKRVIRDTLTMTSNI